MILLGWEVERDYSIISFVALTVDQKRCDYEYEEKSLVVATSGFHPREEKMENLRESPSLTPFPSLLPFTRTTTDQ